MKMPKLAGGSALTSLISVASKLGGAPWAAVLAIVALGLFLTFCLHLVQLLMPQDSHDKVLLWEKILAHRARRHTRRATRESRSRRDARPATAARPRDALPRPTSSSESAPARSP
jgi:hypothetical protein